MEKLLEPVNAVVKLGQGRYAVVTLYSNSTLYPCPVAVKTSRNPGEHDQVLANEHSILQQLASGAPGAARIAQALEFYRPGQLCLEAVLGGPLSHHVAHSQGLAVSTARVYTSELVSVLMNLASMDCVHRDMKANNVLLTSTGHIKVCDFGQAVFLQNTATQAMDDAFVLVGTTHILAPEVVAGIGYDCLVDWWALGVLITEMLTGHPPPFQRDASWPSRTDRESIRGALAANATSSLHDWIPNTGSIHIPTAVPTDLHDDCGGDLEKLRRRFEAQQLVADRFLLEAAADFVGTLLQVIPSDRFGLRSSADSRSLDHSWLLKGVLDGTAEEKEIDFDHRLGFRDFLSSGEGPQSDHSAFEGF